MSLPAELIFEITKDLPQRDLIALCCFSSLYRHIVPQLYRSVFHSRDSHDWESRNRFCPRGRGRGWSNGAVEDSLSDDTSWSDSPPYETGEENMADDASCTESSFYEPRDDSEYYYSSSTGLRLPLSAENSLSSDFPTYRIYNIQSFLNTLCSSEYLLSLVTVVKIIHDEDYHDAKYRTTVESLLGILGSSRPRIIHILTRDFLTKFPFMSRAVAALKIVHGEEEREKTIRSEAIGSSTLEYDHLYSIFCLDHIRQISVLRYGPFLRVDSINPKPPHLSNVTHLSYQEVYYGSDDLVSTMAWPAKLQSLLYHSVDDRCKLPRGSDRHLAKALEMQKKHLEELCIRCSWATPVFPESMRLDSLHDFSSLKRLGLNRTMLRLMRSSWRGPQEFAETGFLPSQLEELQIESDCKRDQEEDWDSQLEQSFRYFLEFLAALLECVPGRFSKLRKVVSWDDNWYEHPGHVDQFTDLLKPFNARVVELMWVSAVEPPLFYRFGKHDPVNYICPNLNMWVV